MKEVRADRLLAVCLLAVSVGACSRLPLERVFDRQPSAETERERQMEEVHRARAEVPASPELVQPTTTAATKVWRSALKARGLRVLVATEGRSLWLMRDTVVLFRAPVAVGKQKGFTYRGKTYDFTTPVGRRRVQAKATDPLWVPPDWHYFETAVERDLKVVQLRKGQRVKLDDGTAIEVRGEDVGRVNQFGNFWAFTPGFEIIFDGTVFIPPFGTNQRRVPAILGTHKLEIGDGYLIHGTNEERSIGEAVSHGCIRMYNEDVAQLFANVPTGTQVYIF